MATQQDQNSQQRGNQNAQQSQKGDSSKQAPKASEMKGDKQERRNEEQFPSRERTHADADIHAQDEER